MPPGPPDEQKKGKRQGREILCSSILLRAAVEINHPRGAMQKVERRSGPLGLRSSIDGLIFLGGGSLKEWKIVKCCE